VGHVTDSVDSFLRSLERLPFDPTAPSRARGSLAWLKAYVRSVRAWDLDLLVSELVTCAVLQAGARGDWERLGVGGLVLPDRVRIEIRPCGASPLVQPNGSVPEGGAPRGLWFVERLSDAWGVEPEVALVWFELRR
jgi:hypothetical protein